MGAEKSLIIFDLKKFNIGLSKLEVVTFLKKSIKHFAFELKNNFLFVHFLESDIDLDFFQKNIKNLAQVNLCFYLLSKSENFEDFLSNPISKVSSFWLRSFFRVSNPSFRVTLKHTPLNFASELANSLDNSLGLGKVDLRNPDIEFYCLNLNSTYYLGLVLYKDVEDYSQRYPHLRPVAHPTSMIPSLARTLVNLAGASTSFLDPFCGSGGFLIEGGILGVKPIGVDCEQKMIYASRMNLVHYGIDSFELFKMDAFDWNKEVECIVTDVPYGKNSVLKQDLSDFVEKFLRHFEPLTSTIIFACPKSVPVNSLLLDLDFHLVDSFELYVHKSLTRVIYVLKK